MGEGGSGGQCDQMWLNFANLATFLVLWKVLVLLFGKLLYILGKFYAIGQILCYWANLN